MLSPQAQKMINDYLNLPFADVNGVRCPYFNNARPQQRGQLRSLVGKGTPQEIVEEAKIISIQYGHDIFDKHGLCHFSPQDKASELRKYLIDHNLGIDCSGFIIHVLDQHYLATKHIKLSNNLFIVPAKKFLRWLIVKLRPIENIKVETLRDTRNTKKISKINDIKPADLIVMLKTGPKKTRDHILLVTKVKNDIIEYVHARAWSGEGRYGHGVAKGKINIIKPEGNLLEQDWQELEKNNQNNETYLEAKQAQVLEIRRIKF